MQSKSIFKVLLLLALNLLILSCQPESKISPKSETSNNFLKVQLNVPSLELIRNVTFDPAKFAKISIQDAGEGGERYEIYLHASINSEGKDVVNAFLYQENKNGKFEIMADNLTDLYDASKAISNNSSIKISTEKIEHVKPIQISEDGCCTVQCSNGRTMQCCNGCCSDPAQGCPQCCG